MNRADLEKTIDASGLNRVADALKNLARLSIRFDAIAQEEANIPIGASKLGGVPDLPEGLTAPALNGVSQSFICQLRLSDLQAFRPAESLPSTGMLYFFYDSEQGVWGFDPKDRSGWAVLYHPNEIGLSRNPEPANQNETFHACTLDFWQEWTLPDSLTSFVDELSLNEAERDLYFELCKQLDKSEESCDHHVFGYPNQIQGDIFLECEIVSSGNYAGDGKIYQDPRLPEFESQSKAWQLLLQIDSDDAAEMMWGDVGRIYYCIRPQDLATRNFDKTWFALQCY